MAFHTTSAKSKRMQSGMRRRTVAIRRSAINKVAASLAILLALAERSYGGVVAKDPALTSIRAVRVGVLVTESTIDGRPFDETRRAAIEFVEERLRRAGLTVVTDSTAPRLLLHLDSPDICDGSGRSSMIIHLNAELLDRVVVSRAAGPITTYAHLWNSTDIEICAIDKREASLAMVRRVLNEFLRAIGIDPYAEESQSSCDRLPLRP